ncbi:MAG: Ku protein [Anaerovoracaceae bacterium]|jgi:DNA end-binding protein Ku
MAVSHKGAISFGLVHIPVSLYTATQDNDIHFNQLHKEDHSRIRYKKTCAHCGKEVTSGDIIKGFEYDKDKYVIITDDDLEKIKTEKDKSIHILHFANLNQISPIYYEKTYHITPEVGGEKAFELLRKAMMDEQKVAIGKTVMGSKETLLAIIPREDGILIQTMFYEDEIKDLPKSYAKTGPNEVELEMAKTLISSMDKPFDPSQYKDEYQERLSELIEQKIAGKEIVAANPEEKSNVIDLMEALQKSIEQTKPASGKATVAKTKAKGTTKGVSKSVTKGAL